MGAGRGKKRNHTQFAQNVGAGDIGVGATLAHLRSPELPNSTQEDVKSDSEDWEVVKRQKKTNYPSLRYSELHRLQSSVKLGDLQSLVLYCVADGTSPQWVSVKHHGMVKKAVVLFIPGMEKAMFDGRIDMGSAEQVTFARPNETKEGTEAQEGCQPVLANGVAYQNPDHLANTSVQSPDDYLPAILDSKKLPTPLKPLADIFTHVWPIKAPGDDRLGKVHSPLQAMLQSPLTKTQEEKKEEKQTKGPRPPREGRNWANKRTPITAFVSSNEDLQENEYILHPACLTNTEERENEFQRRTRDQQTESDGWVDTQIAKLEDGPVRDQDVQQGSLTAGRKILAMDCEMCKVEGGDQALTRISLVDWDGTVAMDELVKPALPVVDYLTPFSGITAAKLDPVETSLRDIQIRLLDVLTPRTVLVGHSLNADLSALKITHPFIIDTSILYPHPRGPPMKSSLKWLAKKYLNREIQKGHGTAGHDSVEDARACLDLVKMKCEKGPQWGTSEATNESIFKRLKRASVPGVPHTSDRAESGRIGAIIDHGTPERNFGMMASHCIGCRDDNEVLAGVKRVVLGDEDGRFIPGGGVDFAWARFRELEAMRGWWNDNRQCIATPSAQTEPSSTALAEAVTKTVGHIKTIRDILPPCTLLIVYSGTGDPREMARLQEMQRTYRREFQTKKWDELSVKWTDTEEQALKAACKKAREGLGLVTIT